MDNDSRQIKGLSPQEVEQSRAEHGSNILTPPKKTPVWRQFLDKFFDPIIRILLLALALSFAVACYTVFTGQEGREAFFEPVGILLAVLLATGVSFYFEYKAGKKFDVLNRVNDEVTVKAIRAGHVQEITRREVVVGDIILLETGNEIPADGELLHAYSLRVNESTLTGEPVVNKTSDLSQLDREATYPSNRVMRGTTVMEGHGRMRVLAVGDATEYGKVYTGSQIENNIETPLNRQLARLGKLITVISYVVAGLVMLGRLVLFSLHGGWVSGWMETGTYLLNTFMMAVTVIVVTIPEGLPMSVALSLALSMKRMLETQNLVRKMHACETMGACTVICTDKTGTLTQNQMRVGDTRFLILGKGAVSDLSADNPCAAAEHTPAAAGPVLNDQWPSRLIKEAIAVNSTAFLDESNPDKPTVIGNPTEGALLLWLRDQGESYEALREGVREVEQLPFTTERKYMATVVDSFLLRGKRMLYVKGAPEIVLGRCTSVYFDGKEEPVEKWREAVNSRLLDYQNRAMRTLGFAALELDSADEASCFENTALRRDLPLKFLGFVAISDPVRADVPAAIQDCLDAGIDIKIVTGDTTATATEIARQVGLWKPSYTDANRITGPQFASLSDEELEKCVHDFKIISRARPMDKERLVKTLQKTGGVVAVTGDGTNDAPALNAAQVGLSMGDGTEVAKEASDITILDNAFSSIVKAVMWGRSLYQNVQRFIIFQLTVNVIACFVIMLGSFLGETLPLTITQMLWVNLIMDTFAAMALSSLPPNPAVMHDKPRPVDAHIITKAMRRQIIVVAIVLFAVLFGLMQYFKYEDVTSLADFKLAGFVRDFFRFSALDAASQGITRLEQSLFFTFFVMLQFWNMFNAKAFLTHRSAFRRLFDAGGGFLPVLAVILIGQVLIVRFGGEMFSVEPVGWRNWLVIIASTSLVLWVGEVIRLCKKN